MTRRSATSIVASPVLVGAVTVLVTIVAVFLAYNANAGLPFVPSYQLSAEIPSGANLVKGNEVRIGGFRVGLVERIRPGIVVEQGRRRAVAVIDLKLDRSIQPLPVDSRVRVRPRSALGLKYVEITPGTRAGGYRPGATIPLARASDPVEFDDVLATFDAPTRASSRAALHGFGDALAGRGASLNSAIAGLRPLFLHLQPVMETLSEPATELDELFRQLGRAAAEAAPVARVQGQLFVDMADGFAAIGDCPECLQDTIAKAPPTLDTGIRSLRVQRPFFDDFAVLTRRLRPAARELPRSLPVFNDALRIARPVLRRSVGFNQETEDVLAALDDLAERPSTLLALQSLRTTLSVASPLLEFVTPYQTVCSYWNYFWYGLGEHISATVPGGTYQRQLLNSTTHGQAQDNRVNDFGADRPADVPANRDPIHGRDENGDLLQALRTQVYDPAIDAQGNADCQRGQNGYPEGPLYTPGVPRRYQAAPDSADSGTPTAEWYRRHAGGSHVVPGPDLPGLAGGTYVSRRLGIAGLDDARRLLEQRQRERERLIR